MRKRKNVFIFIFMLLLLLLLTAIVGGVLINSYLSKVQYDIDGRAVEIEDIQEPVLTDDEILQELLADEPISDEADSAQEDISALDEQMSIQIAQSTGNTDNEENKLNDNSNLELHDNILNILVIGCDTRKKDGVGRSDAMILFSVNEDTEKIHMTSIMRDSYVFIPGKGNNRINAAYAL